MMIPYWGLSLIYWLHMLATVVWIGGLAALSLLILPVARRTLDPVAYSAFLSGLQQRLDPLAWMSLVVLVGTGLFQMSANPNYSGFLSIHNRWAAAILIKHVVFLGMAALSAYLTWGLLPALRRVALRQASGQVVPEAEKLQQRELFLMRINLILGVIILGLTAIARAA
jgi:uncharacterized membrane protein